GIAMSQSMLSVDLHTGTSLDDLRREIDTVNGGEQMAVDKARIVSTTLRVAIDAVTRGLALLALVAALAAMAVLGQLVTRHIRLTAADDDKLRAIGADRGLILGEKIARAAVPILVGCVGAVALAVL